MHSFIQWLFYTNAFIHSMVIVYFMQLAFTVMRARTFNDIFYIGPLFLTLANYNPIVDVAVYINGSNVSLLTSVEEIFPGE